MQPVVNQITSHIQKPNGSDYRNKKTQDTSDSDFELTYHNRSSAPDTDDDCILLDAYDDELLRKSKSEKSKVPPSRKRKRSPSVELSCDESVASETNERNIPHLTSRLFEHQMVAIKWMQQREEEEFCGVRGGMLCDSMGLGKTLTFLCLIAMDKASTAPKATTLIVCNKTLISVWKSEIKRHFKENKIKYMVFHQNKGKKTKLCEIKGLDIVLTTYTTIRCVCEKFTKLEETKLRKSFKSMNRNEILSKLMEKERKKRMFDTEAQNRSFTEEEKEDLFNKYCDRKVQAMRRDPLHHVPKKQAVGHELLLCLDWHRVICDEAHEFRNPKTRLARAVQSISANRRWFVSGTPVQNSGHDLYSALKYLQFVHADLKNIRRWNKNWKQLQYLQHAAIDDWIQKLMLRRVYEEVAVFRKDPEQIKEISYKPKKKRIRKLDPVDYKYDYSDFSTPVERELYQFFQGEAVDVWRDYVAKTAEYANVLVALTRMRQACVSPLLLPIAQDYLQKQSAILCTLKELCARVIIRNNIELNPIKVPSDIIQFLAEVGLTSRMPTQYSTKVKMLLNYLRNIPKDDKALVFCEWTHVLDILGDVLKRHGIVAVRLDGKQSMEARAQNVEELSNPNTRCMLLSLKVGSEGINLTAANHVIFMEPWYNPFVEEQAVARAHRTGQKKKVHVVYFLINKTVEDRVRQIAETKKTFVGRLLDPSSRPKNPKLDKETLRKLIMDNDTINLQNNCCTKVPLDTTFEYGMHNCSDEANFALGGW